MSLDRDLVRRVINDPVRLLAWDAYGVETKTLVLIKLTAAKVLVLALFGAVDAVTWDCFLAHQTPGSKVVHSKQVCRIKEKLRLRLFIFDSFGQAEKRWRGAAQSILHHGKNV